MPWATAEITGTDETTLVPAPDPTVGSIVITDPWCVNKHASTNTVLKIKDGAGGTVKAYLGASANAGGQASVPETPIVLGSGKALVVQAEDAATLRVSMGYKIVPTPIALGMEAAQR